MTFWCESGSPDPCLWLMDPDPDPSISIINLQDANKKIILKKRFFCILHFEGSFSSFFKGKKSTRRHKTVEIKVFFYYFCLVIEGSGSIPLTNGSGSMRPKNMWIRIRIRNFGTSVADPGLSAILRPGPGWKEIQIRDKHLGSKIRDKHLGSVTKLYGSGTRSVFLVTGGVF